MLQYIIDLGHTTMPDALLVTEAGTALFKLLSIEFRKFFNKFELVQIVTMRFGFFPDFSSHCIKD